MAIKDSDLVVYAAAGMPDDDVTGPNGGPVDFLRRVSFQQMGAPGVIQVVSSAAADNKVITVEGRTSAGELVIDARPLNGTTAVDMTGLGSSVERILRVDLNSAVTGQVTVRRKGATIIGQIPPGELGFIAPFRKPASNPSSLREYYTKVFVCNRHATLALLSTVIKEGADPDRRVTHLPAASINDSASTANRLAAPAASAVQASGVFDDADKPIGSIPAGSAFGVWLRLTVGANENPYLSAYTLRVDGQST